MSEEMKNNQIRIKKASGDLEVFDPQKLKASLKNAGAQEDAISEIVNDIEEWVYDGVSTHKLYSRAYSLLNRISKSGAMLYKLKKAIIELGPSGYPFERFIGEIFRHRGYEVEVGKIVQGASVSHEMDVLALRDNVQILAECKFSVKQGHSVSIQVPLYVNSRVQDIAEKWREDERYRDIQFEAWVVTNSRFSPDSIQYSNKKGIRLMGWDYPGEEALKRVIEKEKIYPITILSKLNKSEKRDLINASVVTCGQLLDEIDILAKIGVPISKRRQVQKELETLAEV
nr:hypothetical protein [Candidatus Cloacimonadota bacterium]